MGFTALGSTVFVLLSLPGRPLRPGILQKAPAPSLQNVPSSVTDHILCQAFLSLD